MSSTSAVLTARTRPEPSALLRQLVAGMAPMMLLYVLYTVVRFVVKERGPIEGIKNSYEILRLEQRLGVAWEVTIQNFLLPHEWLVKAANWYYVIGFLPVILACASLSAVLDYQSFLWWRKRFALTLLLAMIGFAIYPLAPPRMLPGMVDTLMVYGPQYYGDSQGSSMFNAYGRIPSMVNVYAAMPSMHVAWSIIAGALLICAFRRRVWSWALGIAHPVMMGISVIVTANHYLLDVVVGVIALIGAIVFLQPGRLWRRAGTVASPAHG